MFNHPKGDHPLSNDDVHVWRTSLDRPQAHVRQLAKTLSDDEHQRAERFYFDYLRDRFIVGRGTLRSLLSRYLGIKPDQVQISYGDNGKPYYADLKIRFNLSHSHKIALFAFTFEREVGIDLEYTRPIPDFEQVARRFFSPHEVTKLFALPLDERQDAFFNCWTRKEAYIKALGDGLMRPLDQFEVTLAPGEPARLLDVHEDPKEIARWALKTLIPGPGYMAALAVEGHDWSLQCLQVP